MNYYNEIKQRILEDEIFQKVKDYSKEKHTLITHYEVGKLLYEAGSTYGDDIIGNYSKKLISEVNKKYTPRTLRRMRQLYQFFEKQKWSPLGTKLSISHIRQLFNFEDNNEINYYANQVEKRNLSKRQLENIIKSKEYERLSIEAKNKLLTNELCKDNNTSSLKRMHQFYLLIEKGATMSHQLICSHYCEFLSLINQNEIEYYLSILDRQNLSVRQLRDKIKSN